MSYFYHYIISRENTILTTPEIKRTDQFLKDLYLNDPDFYENISIIIEYLVPMLNFLINALSDSIDLSVEYALKIVIILFSVFSVTMLLCLALSPKVII
jgi:hypothetical protein